MPANAMPRARAIETVGRRVGQRLRPRIDRGFVEIDRAWHMINGYGLVCGRLASKIVPLLCGKHKPTYQGQRDMGDYVVVTQVAKTVRARGARIRDGTPSPRAPRADLGCRFCSAQVHTGKAMDQKKYWRNSGFPGGAKSQTLRQIIAK